MAIQHSNIPDAQRHEPKGASTATAGQVAKANGDGTTTYVAPNTLNNVTTTTVLESGNTSNQLPVATDTPIQIAFGSPVSGTDITLAADGSITFNTTAYYHAQLNVNFGRSSGAGEAIMLLRATVNGTATGFVQSVKLPDANTFIPLQVETEGYIPAGTIYRVYVMRDSTGINNGGLYAFNPTLAGWDDAPSAWIRIRKGVGRN